MTPKDRWLKANLMLDEHLPSDSIKFTFSERIIVNLPPRDATSSFPRLVSISPTEKGELKCESYYPSVPPMITTKLDLAPS